MVDPATTNVDQLPSEDRKAGIGVVATHAAIFLALMGLWELAARAGLLDPLFFPLPSDIVVSFYRLYITQANIWWHLGMTMTEVAVGFVAGSALGIGLALVVGMFDRVRRYLKPYIIILEATPRIAIGPIVIAAFGFGWTSKTVIVMLVCFFAPFVNTLNGMASVDDEELAMMRSMRASRWQTFTKLMLPDALPEIMAGLRLAMASALGGALVAEFISANEGIGVLLAQYTGTLNMASAFVCVFTLTGLGYLIFRSMEALDRYIVFWTDRDRTEVMGRVRAAKWKGLVKEAYA